MSNPVFLDGVQGDEFDVGVVVAECALERVGDDRDVASAVLVVDLQLRVAFVVGCIDMIDQNRDWLLDVVVLERETDVVAQELPDPEPRNLVDQLFVTDRPLGGPQVFFERQ